MIENFSVHQPQGAVVIDVTEYTDQDTSNKMYNSVLTFFLDPDGETGISIMTDVHTDTYLECIELTLRSVSNLFMSISAQVSVFDLVSSAILHTVNLNELYPNGFDPELAELESTEKPKFLH